MKKIFLIILLALGLRLVAINQSFWLDEGTTGLVSQMNFAEYFRNFAPGDFHPPLYYLLAMLWSRAFGMTEITLRSLSVLSGLGTVYLVFMIGKQVYSEKAGLVSAAILATSGLHIYFSQEARMYVLAAFFVTLSIYSFIKSTGDKSRKYWLVFSLSIAASVMTHYLTILMLPVYFVYVFIDRGRGKYLKKYASSHAVLFFCAIAWLPVFTKQLSRGIGVGERLPRWAAVLGGTNPRELFLVPAKFIFGRISMDNNIIYGFLVLLIAGFYIAVIVRRYKIKGNLLLPKGADRLIWMWLLLPFSLSVIIGLFLPVFNYFRILFILPAFYLLLGVGISTFKGNVFKMLFVLILSINLVSSGIYLFNPKFHREDWKEAVEYIENNSISEYEINTEVGVLFAASSQMETYNYYYNDYNKAYKPICDLPCYSINKVPIVNDINLNVYKTIWLMRYAQPIFDPEDNTRKEIEDKGYIKESEHDFNGVVVWKYNKYN